MIRQDDLGPRVVGYRVRTFGGDHMVGEVEDVDVRGIYVRRTRIRHGYDHRRIPLEGIAWVSDATNTVFLAAGVDPDLAGGAHLGEFPWRGEGPPTSKARDGGQLRGRNAANTRQVIWPHMDGPDD